MAEPYKKLYDDGSYDYWNEMVSADWSTPDIYGTGSYYEGFSGEDVGDMSIRPEYISNFARDPLGGTEDWVETGERASDFLPEDWDIETQSFLDMYGTTEEEFKDLGFGDPGVEAWDIQPEEQSWVDELQATVSGAAKTSREFLSGLTGIPVGDIAKIAGYIMPRQGTQGVQQTRSSFRGPQRRQALPTATLGGRPQTSPAGRSPTSDEVIREIVASNRPASTAAADAKYQTANGQAAIFNNVTERLGDFHETQTGATKPKGPNIKPTPIQLSRRAAITSEPTPS